MRWVWLLVFAAFSFCFAQEKEALKLLKRLGSEDYLVRREARRRLRALLLKAGSFRPYIVGRLKCAAARAEPQIRQSLERILNNPIIRYHISPELLRKHPQLPQMLKSDDPATIRRIVNMLVSDGSPEALDLLARLWGRLGFEECEKVFSLLGRIGSSSSPDERFVRRAAALILDLAPKDSLDECYDALRSFNHLSIVPTAVILMRQVDRRANPPPLTRLDGALRKLAQRYKGNPAGLVALLRYGSWPYRAFAAYAAGMNRMEELLVFLVPALWDPSEEVRAAAAFAICQITEIKDPTLLWQALGHFDAACSWAACSEMNFFLPRQRLVVLLRRNWGLGNLRSRVNQIHLAGEPGDLRLVGYLEAALGWETERERAAAARALGHMRAVTSVDALYRLAANRKEDKGVRAAAVWALALLLDPRSLDILMKEPLAFGREPWEVIHPVIMLTKNRKAAQFLLNSGVLVGDFTCIAPRLRILCNPEKAVQLARELVRLKEPPGCYVWGLFLLAEHMVRTCGKKGLEAVRLMLKSKQEKVKAAAAVVLARKKQNIPADELLAILKKDTSETAEYAAIALGFAGVKKAVPALKHLLHTDKEAPPEDAVVYEPADDMGIAFALALLGDEEGWRLFEKNLKGKFWEKRKACAYLGRVGGERALKMLRSVLREGDERVLDAALKALVFCGTADDFDTVAGFVGSSAIKVRLAAAAAVAAIAARNRKQLAKRAQKILSSLHPDEIRYLVRGYTLGGLDDVVSFLKDALKNRR